MVQKEKERRAYGVREFAELFGISIDSAKRAVTRGDVRRIKLGGRRLVPLSEIERVEREGCGGTRLPKK
ncbi:MAG TPA: helix-turn-helix domain-containing protein [Terriglobales bacterium]|nr:helix-turn-helix domain-containing protein [Terriglobales bacterium]